MKLDDVRGSKKGCSALVVGAGPSTHWLDNRVKRHVTITVNSALYKIAKPDFHCAMDPKMVVREHWPLVMYGNFPVFIPSHKQHEHLRRCILPKKRLIAVPYRGGFNPPEGYSWKMQLGDCDLVKGGSSVHTAIHFAVVLGCNPIYLIGCDGIKKDGHTYFWQYGGYLTDNYIGALQQKAAPLTYFDQCMLRWKWLVEANPDVDLRDCSGGKVSEVVRPASLEELLGGK